MSASSETPSRRRSTGRRPSLDLAGVEALLTSYFSEAHPSVAELAAEGGVTQATVRKYLKLALGSLPRGRAAALPRETSSIRALVNRVPTEAVLGAGRTELLLRRREAGASLTSLAGEFGVSRDRVSKLCRAHAPADEPEQAPAPEEEAAAPSEA